MGGGARSRSAKAAAQQAGTCFVIKVSEDSRGQIDLHLGTASAKFIGQLAAVKETEKEPKEDCEADVYDSPCYRLLSSTDDSMELTSERRGLSSLVHGHEMATSFDNE